VDYLETLQRRAHGTVPTGGVPATYYERARVLGAFATSHLPCAVPPALLDNLEDALTADGGWGRWSSSTVEETAYAVRLLKSAEAVLPAGAAASALNRARTVLSDPADPADPAEPAVPLGHGKDLYAPYRIIRATRLAALYDLGVR
jgi:hypothetical protein